MIDSPTGKFEMPHHMPSTLPEVLQSVVNEIARQTPAASGDWRTRQSENEFELIIPKLSDEGFDIQIIADPNEVTVFSEHVAHQHFTSDGNHAQVCRDAMGLVRDLLSPRMRLRVIEMSGKPVRAYLEIFRNGNWQSETTTTLLHFPFFKKQTEKVYLNRRLPVRENQ